MISNTIHSVCDLELLSEFADCQSEAAFAELANRHADWIYSAALRDAHLAEDVTQAVFIVLAKKGKGLTNGRVSIPGWAASMLGDLVVVYEKETNEYGDGMNLLYGDGHVDFVTPDRANALITESMNSPLRKR